jgi:hypothetical protein
VNSKQLLEVAQGIDAEHLQTVQSVITFLSLKPPQDATLALILAGLIAGRAEFAVERMADAEARLLYDTARSMGRENAGKGLGLSCDREH